MLWFDEKSISKSRILQYNAFANSHDLYIFFQTRLKWRIYEQLKTFTDYALVVQAFNRMGAGPKSKEIIVTTMEDGESYFLKIEKKNSYFTQNAGECTMFFSYYCRIIIKTIKEFFWR